MKRFLLLFLSVLMLGNFQVSAQTSLQTPVEISKDKIRIDGNVFYVHTIKQGQTLYSISKAYDVPISDIEASNPSAKDGLKIGAFLYIPSSSTTVQSTQTNLQTAQEPVQQPDAEKSKKNKKNKKDKQSTQTEYKYRYKRQATAAEDAAATATAAATTATAAAAATASSTVATVPAANGTVAAALETESVPGSQTAVTEQSPAVNDSPAIAPPDADTYRKWNQSHTISLVLPFGKSARYGAAEVNQSDFYSGALLALYDLRQDSRYSKYVLNVVDLDKWDTAEDMLSDTGLQESALIIGPIVPRDVIPVAEYARENRIPMVSPLDIRTSSLAADNPYLFIFPSSAESVQRSLIERFFSDVTDEILIVISEKDKIPSQAASMAAAWSDSTGIPVRNYSYAILQNHQVTADLMNMIPEENRNQARILVASEDEAFVADALRNLNVLVTTQKRNLAVYGLPKWRNFGSVQLEYLHNLNTHISLSYYLDYNNRSTLGMTERFEEIYHTSPTPFAYQGYDITRFFIEALENYGSTFPVEIKDARHSAIQSDIEFHHVGDGGGFANTAVRGIVYRPEWSIENE